MGGHKQKPKLTGAAVAAKKRLTQERQAAALREARVAGGHRTLDGLRAISEKQVQP